MGRSVTFSLGALGVLLTLATTAYAQRRVPIAEDPYAEFSDNDWRRWEEKRAQTGSAEGWPPPWLDPVMQALRQLNTDGLITGRNEAVITSPSTATALAKELFRDWNDPWANAHWQNAILSMTKTAKFSDETVRAAYADGLLEYYHGGGGFSSAGNLIDFAETLRNASTGPDDDLAMLSEELLYESLLWSTQTGNTTVSGQASKAIQARNSTDLNRQPEDATGGGQSPDNRTEDSKASSAAGEDALAQFRDAVKSLGQKSKPADVDINAVGELAQRLLAIDSHSRREREQAVAKYLHVLSVIARRYRDAAPELGVAIDRQLSEFPSSSHLARNTQLRAAWVRCASTLGAKSSVRLRERAQTMANEAESAAARAAFEVVNRSFQRESR